jgi:hypothetical protein
VPRRASPVTYAITHLDGSVTHLVRHVPERGPMVVPKIAGQVHAGRGQRDLTDDRKTIQGYVQRDQSAIGSRHNAVALRLSRSTTARACRASFPT